MSASPTSFPSLVGILEGEFTMSWRVASVQNVFTVNGDKEYTFEVKQWAPVSDFPKKLVENPMNISVTL